MTILWKPQFVKEEIKGIKKNCYSQGIVRSKNSTFSSPYLKGVLASLFRGKLLQDRLWPQPSALIEDGRIERH